MARANPKLQKEIGDETIQEQTNVLEFQDRCLKPLGHPSTCQINYLGLWRYARRHLAKATDIPSERLSRCPQERLYFEMSFSEFCAQISAPSLGSVVRHWHEARGGKPMPS